MWDVTFLRLIRDDDEIVGCILNSEKECLEREPLDEAPGATCVSFTLNGSGSLILVTGDIEENENSPLASQDDDSNVVFAWKFELFMRSFSVKVGHR